MPLIISLIAISAALLFVVGYWFALKQRNMQQWIGRYYIPGPSDERRPGNDEPIELLIAVCDHYEPEWGRPEKAASIAKVDRWVNEYPQQFGHLADSDGRPPQHTFFFPQDEYQPEYLDRLKFLVDQGYGDVDVHLHHHDDTPEGLREKLESFRETLFHQHGLLRRDPVTDEIVWGFIHGNWALCNARPDRQWCGVDHEIPILLETGCYADFTMPSAPSDTQTSTINSIYLATDGPGPKSHDVGLRARTGTQIGKDQLLMIQGPLVPDWGRRKLGILPRIENGDLHDGRPPSMRRLQMWLDAHVHVAGRPEQFFIKLHTHGCKDGNIDTLLGDETVRFHEELAEWASQRENVRYRYVTAWEMACAAKESIKTPVAVTSHHHV